MINSQAEQQALAPKTSVKTYWIGLYRDPKDNSRWMWVDGSRPGYSAWRTGEPNNWMGQGVEEDCTEMYVTWNDLACKSVAPYICEIDGRCEKKKDVIYQLSLLRTLSLARFNLIYSYDQLPPCGKLAIPVTPLLRTGVKVLTDKKY